MAVAIAMEQIGGFASAADRLSDAVTAVATEDLSHHTDVALGEDLISIRHSLDRLEAEFGRRVRRFERLKGHLADGAVSIVSWVRYRCRLSAAGAAQRVEIARHLDDLPGAQDAFRAGEIGYGHAAALARTAAEVGPEVAGRMGGDLLHYARRLDPGRLRLVGRHLRHCVDPDGAHRDAQRDHERRYLHVSQTFDGVFVVDGLLDAEGGAVVRTAIDALTMPKSGDEASAAQRRADALVELATRQLGSGGLPSRGGQKPHLTVTVPVATLQRQPGAPGADLAWGGCLPAESALRIACDAALTVVEVDGAGQPLSVGRTKRTIPPAIRRALAVRDKGCRAEGCDRPIEWTDGHHDQHWAEGGPTALSNLVLLCRPHHRMVHKQQRVLRMRPLGGSGRPP
jgi:hypothetical protein